MTNYYKTLMHSSKETIFLMHSSVKPKMNKREMTEQEKDQHKINKLVTSISNAPYPTEAVNRAIKAANYEWYVANKQWKKEYNAKYYQNNKEYWKRRYEKLKNQASDYAETFATDELHRALGLGSIFSDSIVRSAPNYIIELAGKVSGRNSTRRKESEYVTTGNRVIHEFLIAQNNYVRAIREEQEYKDFMKGQNKMNNMKLSDLHKAGTGSIVKAGKDFISNWKSGIKSLFS